MSSLWLGPKSFIRVVGRSRSPVTRGAPAKEENLQNTLRSFLFRTLAPVSFATICVYVTYAKEGPALVPIARNLAWNDFITQIKFLPQDSPQDSIDKEMPVIQRFLKEHETETNVGVYDLAVFRAIDQVRARLHKADKDLETLRNELSYKEEQARLGR